MNLLAGLPSFLTSRRLGALVTLLIGLLTSSPVRAEPTKQAREASKQAFIEARGLWKEGDFLQACAKFEQSYQLAPSVGNLLNLGRCAERRGKLATARRYIVRSAEMAEERGEPDRVSAARDMLAGIEPRLIRIDVSVDPQPEGLEVTLDGEPVPLPATAIPVDPGAHRVAAYAPGYEREEERIETKSEGEMRSVALTLTPLPSPSAPTPAEPEREADGVSGLMIGGIVTASVGVVGLVLGGVFGSMALSKDSELEDACSDTRDSVTGLLECPSFTAEELQDEKDLAKRNANISTGAFAAGGALVGIGITLIVVDALSGDVPEERGDVVLLPHLGPRGGGLGLRALF